MDEYPESNNLIYDKNKINTVFLLDYSLIIDSEY